MGPRATQATARILEAGRQVFHERGYAGASVDAIAEAAGVSRTSVYTYFRSKRDILITLGAADNARMQDTVMAFPGTLDRQAVAEWVMTYLEFLEADSSIYYTWAEASRIDEALRVESLHQYDKAWRTLARRIKAASGKQHEKGNEVVTGMLLMAACERAMNYLCDLHADVARKQFINGLVDLIRAVGCA